MKRLSKLQLEILRYVDEQDGAATRGEIIQALSTHRAASVTAALGSLCAKGCLMVFDHETALVYARGHVGLAKCIERRPYSYAYYALASRGRLQLRLNKEV